MEIAVSIFRGQVLFLTVSQNQINAMHVYVADKYVHNISIMLTDEMSLFSSQFKSNSLLCCIPVLQIYTATNAKARELLYDRLVSEITMKWRIYFGPDKYSNAEGLWRIIDDYR